MVFLYFVVGVATVPEAPILVVAIGIEVFVAAQVLFEVDLVEAFVVLQVVVICAAIAACWPCDWHCYCDYSGE